MRLSHLFRPSVFSVSSVGTLLALVVALASLLTAPLGAQTAKSRSQLYTDIDTNLPSTTGAITAAVLRTQLKNVVASAYNVVVADAQPLDSDLTAIAALTTTSFGRGLLTEASAATLKTTLSLNLVTNTADADKPVSTAQAAAIAAAQAASQPLDADLTSIAALTTTAFGRSFLPLADASAGRTLLGLGSLATQSGTFSGTSSGTNTGDNAVNSLYSGLVSNATHTGDATGATALTLATVNANVGSFGSATAGPTFTVNAKGLITAAGSATITPAVGSITGLGTGIAAALAINTGNSGAPVLIDGALGTPTSGVGTNLTALNATQLTTGTVPDARFPATLPIASGINLTALNATNLGSGTVPDARFPATLPIASGINLTALNATNLGSGTVPDARFPATLPIASGINLTALNATNLGSGTVPAARFPALTGEATTSAGAVAVTLSNSAVIGKVLTGYTSGAGTVAATDTILQAVQKLNGNAANLQPLDAELTAISGLAANGLIARTSASTAAARTLTGTAAELTVTNGDGVSGNPTLSLPSALTFTGKTVTGGTYTSPTLTTPTIGDGSAAAPSLSFTSETTTGLFRPSASVLGMAVAGTSRATLTTTGMTVAGTITPTGSVHGAAGTVGNPALSFNTDQDTGLYHIGANNLGVAAGGAKVLDVATTGLGVTGALSATGLVSSQSASAGATVFRARTFDASGVVTPLFLFERVDSAVSGQLAFDGASARMMLRTTTAHNLLLGVNSATIAELSSAGLEVTGTGRFTGATMTLGTGFSAAGALDVGFDGNARNGISLTDSTDTSSASFATFRKASGAAIGSIARVTTTDAVILNTSSDGRLKENLRDFTDSGRLIDSLKPRVFDWKNSDENGKNVIGFIAQEQHAADPIFAHIGAVSVGDEDPETITKQWQRSDSALIPIVVAELQSLRARVAQLEAQNQSLDARMAAVEALLKK